MREWSEYESWMYSLPKKKSFESILFTDVKVFTTERLVNSQNDRQCLRNSMDIIENFLLFQNNNKFLEKNSVEKRHFPMWWCGRNFEKLTTYFEARNDLLELTFQRWTLDALTGLGTVSSARSTIEFAIWLILEQRACAKNHGKIDSLKRALQKHGTKSRKKNTCKHRQKFS